LSKYVLHHIQKEGPGRSMAGAVGNSVSCFSPKKRGAWEINASSSSSRLKTAPAGSSLFSVE
jgi:hypothetical protein